jgi:hypothetical protein
MNLLQDISTLQNLAAVYSAPPEDGNRVLPGICNQRAGTKIYDVKKFEDLARL